MEMHTKFLQLLKENKPYFEISNLISILISADYLKMQKLVDEWIDYFIAKMNDILRLPIDMNCISSALQRKVGLVKW